MAAHFQATRRRWFRGEGVARPTASAVAGLLVVLALLVGCAAAPSSSGLRYRPEPQATLGERLWPSPPEIPRYRYVGDLLGEQNLATADEDERSGFSHGLAVFWSWLTGLHDASRPKIELQRPQSGITDPEGRVYVTDISRGAVFVFDTVRGELRVWEHADGRQRFQSPVGIAIDGNGHVLVTDAKLGAVYRFLGDGSYVESFGKGILQRPTGITFDPVRAHIYVADTDANDVKIFDDRGRLVDTLGFTGEGPGRLNRPVHVAFAQDRLYVSDAMNARVQVFDRDGNALRTVGERGLYVGNLTRPKGVALDRDGHIYVVEGFYDHLLVFDRDGKFLMSIGGTGQRPGQFYLPAGVWTDRDDRIYVADMFNGRVSVYQFLGDEP